MEAYFEQKKKKKKKLSSKFFLFLIIKTLDPDPEQEPDPDWQLALIMEPKSVNSDPKHWFPVIIYSIDLLISESALVDLMQMRRGPSGQQQALALLDPGKSCTGYRFSYCKLHKYR